MKKISLKIISSAIVIIFIASIGASATSFPAFIHSKSMIRSSEHVDLSFPSPKIESILEMITEDLIEEFMATLVGYGPRYTGTYGCEKSADYIHQQFTEMGLDARFQNWESFGNKYHPRFFSSQNVEGTLVGSNSSSDAVIAFGAHYDTARVSPGGNDDGSGTVAVLAAAYALSHFEFEHTVKFVAFSGEEIGLLGSHAYAKEAYESKENILAYMNADMMGHATTAETGRKMGIPVTEDAEWIFNVVDHINNDYDIHFSIDYGFIDREGRGWGDYHSFVEYGYETISFWGGEGDPNMHTPDDDFDNVNISYLVNTTRIIAGTLAYLADTYDTYPQVQIESPQMGKLYFGGMKKRNISDLKTIVVDDIWIWADVKFATVPIVRADFYYDENLEYTDTEPPFKWNLNKFSLRKHRITIVVYDELGRNSIFWRDIRFINPFPRR